ncbi:hypothetical protein [Mesorhizobium sp. M0159]|uniref:hypothetical protein n=1 Tax=Mesorhizobium sp. M0159 TaxID=2956900 RepID=UPI003337E5F2
MLNGKCPKCENVVQQGRMEHMNISDGTMSLKAFSAACPHCNTILGVVLDPRPPEAMLEKIMKALRIR